MQYAAQVLSNFQEYDLANKNIPLPKNGRYEMHGENTQLFSYPLNRTLFPLSAPRTPRPRGAPICAEEGTVPFFFLGGGGPICVEKGTVPLFFPLQHLVCICKL
ncbi:hypothetical protein MDV097.3 [Gallid alphaherpesvirus 2]|uniref:Uncharacterized protein n=2 Tax=Gallid alphaherpesvirus 2 TaxID=10390 RepID=H6WUM6_9ALPH|nr:hypothetical protein MDV097.3 [Gallid alphaherpesvirus 2]UOW60185.1 hypothetical protein MDV097.3 [Gallid alphaherpesvirus 2]UOW60701.1 hypothetical protein MDV097.3 [Gallid alphaherpesvirus 2]UOW60874.1 hypothetical protein MDV097.3 [Gallid alphaherpesvirus 2]UOW61213.1 hypothetical protein MDV097.3 [Gallid alphaherpesvirus 2]